MTENEIKEHVTHLFNAVKADDDPTMRKISATLLSMVLVDLHRIADAMTSTAALKMADASREYLKRTTPDAASE